MKTVALKHRLAVMVAPFQEVKQSLRRLYLEDARPWLVGFSGRKDSTMVASLVFDAVLSVPPDQHKKPVAILCTDTRVEIPAISELSLLKEDLENKTRSPVT